MSTSDSDCWLDISNTATRSRISRDGPSGGVPALMLAAALALGAQEAKAQGVFHCPAASPPAAASFPKGFDHRLITKDHLQAVYRASLPSIRAVRRLVTLTEPVECGFVDDGHRNVVVRNPRITSTQDYVPGIYAWRQGSNGDLVVYVHSVDATDAPQPYRPRTNDVYAARTMGDGEFNVGWESHGIWAEYTGHTGRVAIDLRDLSLATGGGRDAFGIWAFQRGTYVFENGETTRARGAVIVNVIESERDREGRVRPVVGTRGVGSDAIRAEYDYSAAYGHIAVTVEGYTIATGGIVPKGPQFRQLGTEDSDLLPSLDGSGSRGIYARHEGLGDIRVAVTDSHVLTWGGSSAHGIFADHLGSSQTITNEDRTTEVMTGGGAVDIDVTGGEIRTAGDTSLGIYGRHRGAGDVAIDATGVTIATTGEQAYGVLAYIRQAMTKEEDENVAILGLPGGGRQGRGEIIAGTGEGDIAIAVTGGAISTEGKKSIAVWGQHEHEGDLDISVSGGATVATEGAAAHGVFASQGLATTTRSGADPSTTVVETRYVESSGDLAVAVAGGATVTTAGGDAHGVFAQHQGAEGDVAVTIEGGSVATEGDAAHGVYASKGIRTTSIRTTTIPPERTEDNPVRTVVETEITWGGSGDLTLAVTTGSDIATKGSDSTGVRAVQGGRGALVVAMSGGSVRTTGYLAHGIYAARPADAEGRFSVTVSGGSVVTEGLDSAGVYVFGTGKAEVTIGKDARISAAENGILSVGSLDLTATVAGRVEGDIRADGAGDHTVTVEEGGTVTGTISLAAGTVAVDGAAWRVYLKRGGTVTVGDNGRITGIVGEAIRSDTGDLTVTVSGAATGHILGDGDGRLAVTVQGSVDGDILQSGRGALELGIPAGGVVTGTVHDPASPLTVGGSVGRLLYGNGGTVIVAGTGRITGVEGIAIRATAGNLVVTVAAGGEVEGDIRAVAGRLTLNLPAGSVLDGTIHNPVGLMEVRGSIGRLSYDNGGTITITGTGRLTGVEIDGRREAIHSAAGNLDVTVAAGGEVEGDIRAEGDGDLDADISGRVSGDILGLGAGEHTVTVGEGGTVTGTIHLAASTATVHGAAGRVRFDNGGTVTVGSTGRITGIAVEGRSEAIRNAAGDLAVTVAAGTVAGGGEVGGDIRADGDGDLAADISGRVSGDILGLGAGEHTVTVGEGGEVTGTIHLAAGTATVHGAAGRVRFDNGGTVTVGSTGRITRVAIEGRSEAIRNAAGDLAVTVAGGGEVGGDIRAEGGGDLAATVSGEVTGDILGLGAGKHTVTVGEGGAVEGTLRFGGGVNRVELHEGGRIRSPEGRRAISNEGGTLEVVVRAAGEEAAFDALKRVEGRLYDQGRLPDVKLQRAGEEARRVGRFASRTALADGVHDVGLSPVPDREGEYEFMRDHAPRARVYEALPSVVLGMNGVRGFRERMAAPRSAQGGWARVETFSGKWEAEASTSGKESGVGLEHRHHRHGIQAGLAGALGEAGRLGASLHHRRGSAEVSEGGGIELSGTGVGVSGTWVREEVYVDVQAEVARYEADLTSSRRGVLKKDVSGHGHALGVEAGRRLALERLPPGLVLTPRAGLVHSKVSVGGFSDAVGARVTVDGARSLKGRVGVDAEVTLGGAPGSRVFGSVEVEHEFSTDRKVRVSGRELKSEAEATWLRLGLDGAHTWNDGRYTLQGGMSYAKGGGDNYEFGSRLSLKVRF